MWLAKIDLPKMWKLTFFAYRVTLVQYFVPKRLFLGGKVEVNE